MKGNAMLNQLIAKLCTALSVLALLCGGALAQSKVTISIGGAGCLCYLPTVLAQQLDEYRRPASRSSWSISRADRSRLPR
jgi:hypothetical protein